MQPPKPPESGAQRPQSGSDGLHNPGCPFDAAWIARMALDDAELEARAAALAATRPAEPSEAVELVRAIGCIDLTTLADDDTEARVRALCARALDPVPAAILRRLGILGGVRVAAVCVFPAFVPAALEALRGSGVRVCTVAAGFPDGAGSLAERLSSVVAAREAGAEEIDVVIRRPLARAEAWRELHDEIRALHQACGSVPMKVILGTGELRDATMIARAGATALSAGAAYLKTSTGKEAVNATLPAGLALARVIRDHARRTGFAAGLKPAGGISSPAQALAWTTLVRAELGEAWLTPKRLRIGASSLLDNLVERLGTL